MPDSPSIGPPRLYINDLCQLLESYLPQEQVQEVYRAYLFAKRAHQGQVRRSGEDFIHHPIAVAYNLAQLQMDMEALSAALLHDVIEDTGNSKKTIVDEFGDTVAELVDGVSKLNRMEFETREQAQAASFRKMVLAMSRDIRVIIVKLADRLHNIRTIGVMKTASRRRIARETLDIYAPIASRLGMNKIRLELEDLSFAALHPLRYKIIKNRLEKLRDKREEHFKSIHEALQKRLETYNLPYLEIQERDKYPYTIYRQIREAEQLMPTKKHRTFQRVTRSYGFRVITDSVDNCYRALGGVHSLYKPVLGCFNDYISIPKLNGYQSLHTIVLSSESGQQGQQIEVHIRTQTMHELTEYGVAAYGLYNRLDTTKSCYNVDIEQTRERAEAWIQGLVDMQKNVEDSLEFINHVKSDLLPEEVYVFTPKGHIQQLAKGATGLDFAYSIHSAVGNRCIAIKIDGRYAPLYETLKSGQTVEVSTTEWARPSPDWLDFVISAKARNHIVQYLKNQNASKAIDLGKRLLSKQLLKYNLFADEVEESQRTDLAQYFKLDSWDDLLKEIGLGNIMAIVVANHFNSDKDKLSENPDHTMKPLIIKGDEGRVVTFSRCCHPIPGDEVIGYPSAGKGIVIHTNQCKNIMTARHTQPEKFLLVSWSSDIKGEFLVDIQIEVKHERGVLAKIGALLADMNVNIENISNENKDGLFSILRLCLAVNNRKHLANIMRALKRLYIVTRVQRCKN